MAEVEHISNWNTNQVVSWFKGLDDALQVYIPHLLEAEISGAQLLALDYDDLDNLGVVSIGHQELILEGTDLLKQLHLHLDTENLQSHALNVNCRCRALRSTIYSRKRNGRGTEATSGAELKRGAPVSLIRLAADVLDASKILIMWLDRPPFMSRNDVKNVRGTVVNLSYELSITMQQTVFACVIEDAALSICKEMEVATNQLIVSNDPMTLQPSSLEQVHLINRDQSPGLGLFIKTTFEGYHVITGTKEGSISSRIRRIASGDEVVAVNGQTVVGWLLAKLVATLKNHPSDITITLKKRPHFSSHSSAMVPVVRRQQAERIPKVPPPISPIRKVADSRKNSSADLTDTPNTPARGSVSSLDNTIPQPTKMKHSKKKKKKKFTKIKAKSSGNISGNADKSRSKKGRYSQGSDVSTRPSSSQRNSMNSFASSHDSSLRSASSTEAILSKSTGFLSKHANLRQSLELGLPGNRNIASAPVTAWPQNQSPATKNVPAKLPKSRHKSLDNVLKPSIDNALKDLNSNQLKRDAQRSKSQSQLLNSDKNDLSKSKLFNDKPVILEPPCVPLDFLVIPPPPADPYTPRKEKLVVDLNISDSSIAPPSQSGSESPNSRMDTELRRRFTVIGSEASDEKWYEALLAEINANKAKRTDGPHRKRILGRLEESGASDDNVFFSAKLASKDEGLVEYRQRKPNLRHRPVSMPPNYYSPLKLQQFRVTNAVKAMNRKSNVNRSIATITDENTSSSSNISPVAHVEDNGVKKLAPLNYDLGKPEAIKQTDSETSWKSRSPTHRHSWYTSSATNTNNSNSSGNSSGRSKVPPKPPPRSSSVTLLTNKENEINTADRAVRAKSKGNMDKQSSSPLSIVSAQSIEEVAGSPRSHSDKSKPREALMPYVGLLKLRNSSTSGEVLSRPTSANDISSHTQERPTSPSGDSSRKLDVANELTKYWERKKSSSSAKDEGALPSKTQPSVPRKQVPNLKTREYSRSREASDAKSFEQSKPNIKINEQTGQTRQALVPPVAKPRTKVKSLSSLPQKNPLSPPPTVIVSSSMKADKNVVDSRTRSPVKSYDNDQEESLEVFERSRTKTKVPPVPPLKPRKSDTSVQYPQKKENILGRIKSAQTSRGSYIAAIDVGYALQNYKREKESLAQDEASHSVPHDTESYEIKHIGGVKVRIRKGGPNKTHAKHKSPEKSRIGLIKSSELTTDMRSQRRISCRDLGQGECDGWLWKKKSTTNSPLSSKWSKRWVVLKDKALYCYRDPDDEKAESYIGLPGYQIAPAPECKRRLAFRVVHLQRKTFYFASDRQMDMSRWMNKMGLAAIEYSVPNARSAANKPDTTAKDGVDDMPTDNSLQYYSESESEDAFVASAESGKHSSIAYDSNSASSSPEKSVKTRAQSTIQSTSLDKDDVQHFSTPQSVLNKSARFQHKTPKKEGFRSELNNKLLEINEDNRHRSKSEAGISSNIIINKIKNGTHASSLSALENQDVVSVSAGSSPFSSPRKEPAVDAHQRRQKLHETKNEQSPISNSLDLLTLIVPENENQNHLKPARSMEEIHHLKSVAAKKAGEVAKKQTVSVERSQSFDSLEQRGKRFTKNVSRRPRKLRAQTGVQGLLNADNLSTSDNRLSLNNSAPASPTTSPGSPKIIKNISRRDVTGRPRLRVQSSEVKTPTRDKDDANKGSSIDDLCKALQSAEVDIHGVNRRTTLRRKMTILSRDPKKNDMLMRKRVLQRQLKALQGELDYFNGLLDRPSITSEELHGWINQHPALVAEMGTIRRLSKRRRKPAGELFEKTQEGIQEENLEVESMQPNMSSNNHLKEKNTPVTDDEKSSPEKVSERLDSEKSEDAEPKPLPRLRESLADRKDNGLSDGEICAVLMEESPGCPSQIVEQQAEQLGPNIETSLESPDSLSPKPQHGRPRSIAISFSSFPVRMRPRTPPPQREGSEQNPDEEMKTIPVGFSPTKSTKHYLETDL